MSEQEAATVLIDYTNWRNVRAMRRIHPLEIRFGSSEWHKTEQWLLRAVDMDNGNASKPYREDLFYSKMWIKLLPMHVKVESHKDVVYRTYEQLNIAFANKGISLEAIEQLKRMDITRPPRPPKLIEHDPKR
jgi:hypothetical protein